MTNSAQDNRTIQADRNKIRPTIGVLIDYARPVVAGGYQSILWSGISDVAKKRNVNLICFSGRALKEPYAFETQRNVIYDLVDPVNVDGLILCGGLGNFVSPDAYQVFCDRFQPLPIVSIAFPVEGAANVLVESGKGLQEAVAHLVEIHGKTRFAFICGAEGNREAEQRYRTFRKALDLYGLTLDDARIAQGDFLPQTGVEAVQAFFDQRKLKPGKDIEVLFAANDGMALGALKALQSRQIAVPYDVALVGFDDIPESSLVLPGLTTVRQPLYEQGQLSVQIVLDLLEGKSYSEPVTLQAEFVTRQSCGCLPQNVKSVTENIDFSTDEKSSDHGLSDSRRKEYRERIRTILRNFTTDATSKLSGALLDRFISEVQGSASKRFISSLGKFLRNTRWSGDAVKAWHQIISVLHQCTGQGIAGDRMALRRANVLLQQARIYVGEMAYDHLAYRILQSEEQAVRLSKINEVLSTTFNIPELMHVLARELPCLGIRSCYLSLYEKDYDIPSQKSLLLLAYHEGGRISLPADGLVFPSLHLAPAQMLPQKRRTSMLVQPLFFKNNHLGFVLFEIDLEHQDLYEILRGQISTALQGAILFEDRERARLDLARSNEDLDQFATIASHDLKEPLRTISSYIQLVNDKTHEALDEEARAYIRAAASGASRLNILISDLLAYSRVNTRREQFHPVHCNALIKEVLAGLGALIDRVDPQITCEDLPTVWADKSQLQRVFQNLIDNAVKFKADRPLKIHIGAKRRKAENESDHWVFFVQDNGIGIEKDYHHKIFRIFQRLHSPEEYGGTGIGLAICKKIIEHHHGRIWAESRPGQGTIIFFSIPDRAVLQSHRFGSNGASHG